MTTSKKPDKLAIRDQLQRILENIEFKASEKQRRFLSFIVTETLEGRSSQIKGYTVAVSVYGRTETFDPQVDPIVRVEAGRLRRALNHYYLTAGRNDPVHIIIPTGTYVPAFHSGRVQPSKATISPRASAENKVSQEPTIAVMPLDYLGDADQSYFAEGLTEELTTEIARYQDLRVIASQSTMRFKGQTVDHRKIGHDLGVRYLVTGNVRKDPNTIKIIIRLLDSSTGWQLWSKSYKREQTAVSLIHIQEEIAYSVSGIIADQYGLLTRRLSRESRKKAPADLKTYDAVLRFYHYETELTPEAFDTALAALENAIEVDPDYGMAYAMIGHLHADNYALGFRDVEAPLERALNYAQKGVALEPQNQFARDALTLVYFHHGDKESFLKHAKQTLDLNPNSPYVVGVTGWHTALFGEWDQGLALLEKGMQLNPYYPTWFHLAPFMNCYRLGKYEDAYEEALKFNFPTLFWDPVMRAATLAQMGRPDEADSAVKQLLKIEKDFETKGRSLISRYLKVEAVADMIVEGLRKAGLHNFR